MPFASDDVRDHIVCRKNDYEPSYALYGASLRWKSPKIDFREIFGVDRFSTFATWGNSGIEPDKGIGNQLSRDRGASFMWPSNDGELQWNTMLDWTCR
jgi:hypothetical protein